jgi:zinc protease
MRIPGTFVFILSAFAFVVSTSFAQTDVATHAAKAKTAALDEEIPVDPRITVGELENGLRYYIRENRKPEDRAVMRLVVNAGSILETDAQQGLAHFCEHMAFNGTKEFEKLELVNYLESLGMRFGPDLNAYTSFDETVYKLTLRTDTAEVFEKGFLVLSEWAQNVAMKGEDIDDERGVIVEEWRGGRGAGARMRDEQFPILFKNSRYAERLPIGKMEIVKNFEYETLRSFYDDWYRPELMSVVVVGDFDKDVVEGYIKEYFGDMTNPDNPKARELFDVPDHDETLYAIATDKEAGRTVVTVYHKLPKAPEGKVADYRDRLIDMLYGRMFNKRLAEQAKQADPPFLMAQSGKFGLIRTKDAYALMALTKDDGVEEGLEALLLEAERVRRHGFTESELERAKAEMLRQIESSYNEREKTESRSYVEEYTRNYLEDEPIPGIEYEYELWKRFIPEIAIEEINAKSDGYLTEKNRVVMVSAPEKEGLETPTEASLAAVFDRVGETDVAAYEDEVSDLPLLDAELQGSEIVDEKTNEEVGVEEFTLANGVKVVAKKTDFKNDEILCAATSPGGVSLASDDEFLSASVASAIVNQSGLGEFDDVALDKKLAGKLVRLSAGVSVVREGFYGTAAPEDFETLFKLIYLNFTAPRKDETAFKSFMSRQEAAVKNRGASPEQVFQDTINATLTQYHFRRLPLTEERLAEVDLDEAYDFFVDRYADASDFTFFFVGAFDSDELRRFAKTYLGSLPTTGREENWKDDGARYPEGVIVKEVRKGVEPKSVVQITFTGAFDYSDQTVYDLRAMTDVLSIALRERVREAEGGTYGVSVRDYPGRIPVEDYRVDVSFGCDPERVDELIGDVFEEIERLKNEGPKPQDVEKVREKHIRGREISLKKNRTWLSSLRDYYRRGVDPKAIYQYETMIHELTAEQIQAAAKKYLNTENYAQFVLYPED